MSKATFTFGRFNPPTESGHGKLVGAVQKHAEESGGKHYIFPTHSQDSSKNPLTHGEKVGAMKKLFPSANVVSHGKVKTVIDAMKHLESKGHTHVTMVVGSDRVSQFHGMLNKYRTKEYPKIKKIEVKSAGHRDPDAEGEEGESASKHRALVVAGKRKEFISKYSDPKLGAEIHDKVKKAMNEETKSPIGIFLLGGPGSGKDYVLKNIFSRFDLTEVQIDQLISGNASELTEGKKNIVINGASDLEKVDLVKSILEGYEFDTVYVSVTNKVSKVRNEEREMPLPENKRLEKWYRAEKFKEELNCFVFNNSINLNESNELERVLFAGQIEKLLERLVDLGLEIKQDPEPKSFTTIKEKYFPPVAKHKSGLPKKYVGKLSDATAAARKAHWKKMGKLSDSDPRAYEPAPGDASSKTKPSKHTIAVRKMMASEAAEKELPKKVRHVARSGNITKVMDARKETGRMEESADSSLTAKAKKSGISVGTLRKVYKRGVAAWNSGHRPGTTPQQWGHARVNSYINKGKTYHTADKDLREETEDLDSLFEMQLVGTDEYRKHAIAMTPGQSQEIANAFTNVVSNNKKNEEAEDCGCGGDCQCEQSGGENNKNLRRFSEYRLGVKEAKEETVDVTPTLSPKKKKSLASPPRGLDSTLHGLPVTTNFNALESVDLTLEEAVEYHLENKISFTENVFRPGSDMFFQMIGEAKRLYKEGKYEPTDEYEVDLLNSDIGEKVMFEGQEVMLDFPFEEELNEADDPTNGKGIGKPFRQGSGAAVYVRTGDGGVRKVNFSQSGMKKRYNEPARVRSFVARHKCLSNKDKTSASYWACRWPRFFSNTGQLWW